MPDSGTRTRSLSLRKIVLFNTGQDVSRCMGCQFCDVIPSHELDIPLTSMIQLVNLNDEEVLTSKTLWSAEVLAHAKEACSRQLNLEAIILALRSEAVLRGLMPEEITKKGLSMKLAISGKGGVGKTTLAALLAQVYADDGRQVLAVDADPSPCLAGALGFPPELRQQLRPIAEMDALIEERTGAKPGTIGGFFTINPRVDDIPERFSVLYKGVRLLEMGSVDFGGSGCICPEAAMLKTLFTHLLFRPDDILILDMYAGVEHLGRATVDFVDAMLIVVEPTRRSIGTATQIQKLAKDIGLSRIWLVGNKVRNPDESDFLQENTPGIPVLGWLPADLGVQEADRLGIPVYDHVPALRQIASQLADVLSQQIAATSQENTDA